MTSAKDKSIVEEDSFDPKNDVSAYDAEDGDLTSKIEISENTVDTKKAGTYKVTYKVSDNKGEVTILTITVTVKENNAPGEINYKARRICSNCGGTLPKERGFVGIYHSGTDAH